MTFCYSARQMRSTVFTPLRKHRDLVVGLLLAVFALRAFVPAGYMPSMGLSLLEMCRAGFPGTALASGDAVSADPASPQAPAHDDHSRGEHCLFATLAAAPIAQPGEFASPQRDDAGCLATASLPDFDQSLRRAQKARGPPVLS